MSSRGDSESQFKFFMKSMMEDEKWMIARLFSLLYLDG